MNIPKKTAANGFAIPVFSLGTWMIGGSTQKDESTDFEREIDSIRRAINHGVTCIDTAELYANGFAEELVGRAMAPYPRTDLQIISKVSPENLGYENVLRAAENSLKRLRTDYLDVYLVHRPNRSIPLSETMRAMRSLLDRGLIKNAGMSNAAISTLENAGRFLERPIVLNQVHYNLIYRGPERCGLLDYCRERKILLMAWRPVQKGDLCKVSSDILQNIAQKYGKSPAQIAINWLLSQDNVISLSTMRSQEHLEENLGALGWTMDRQDVEMLRSEFPGQQDESNSEPLL